MRHFITIATLAATVITIGTQPAYANVARTTPTSALSHMKSNACRIELGSAACDTYQQQLLNAVLKGAGSTRAPGAVQKVADRQLDVLIASIG